MSSSLIAIVGSADKKRTDYNPPLRNVERVHEAAESLGKELAQAGYNIVVYSSDPAFIEAAVVRGYVGSGKARAKSIQVRYPQVNNDGNVPFPEEATRPDVFDPRLDPNANWEVSFYASLREIDGIVLLGGARSAFVTGVLAQIFRIPLLAIATFGGSAQAVWALAGNALASEEDRNLMGMRAWGPDTSAKLVKCIEAQRTRLEEQASQQRRVAEAKRHESSKRAAIAGLLFLAAVALTAAGMFLPQKPLGFAGIFFAIPLLAGATGSVIRTILNARRGESYQGADATFVSIVLGMVAGLAAAILFALAQWASNPQIKDFSQGVPPTLSSLFPFMLLIGLVAGLTLELVYKKLQETDVTQVGPLSSPGAVRQ